MNTVVRLTLEGKGRHEQRILGASRDDEDSFKSCHIERKHRRNPEVKVHLSSELFLGSKFPQFPISLLNGSHEELWCVQVTHTLAHSHAVAAGAPHGARH